jgi:hypothetical protein
MGEGAHPSRPRYRRRDNVSEQRNAGGPAFPVFTNQYHYGFDKEMPATVAPGMTLRDYFAAKALEAQIMKLHGHSLFDEGGCTYAKLSLESYLVADAMLKAREA